MSWIELNPNLFLVSFSNIEEIKLVNSSETYDGKVGFDVLMFWKVKNLFLALKGVVPTTIS